MRASVILPIRNQDAYVKQAVFAVLSHTVVPFELILVNDASGRSICSYLRHLPKQRLIDDPTNAVQDIKIYQQKIRRGFPVTCNNGIKYAQGEYICLLNTDTWVTPKWLQKMIEVGDALPRAGILGPSTNIGKQVLSYKVISRMRDLNKIGALIARENAGLLQEMYLSGFCFVVKKEVFDKVGLFDERFGLGTGEEGEFTTRAIDANYQSLWVKDAYVHHFGGKSFKADKINGHRLRSLTQRLANAITDERRGKKPKHDIDALIQRIQKFNR